MKNGPIILSAVTLFFLAFIFSYYFYSETIPTFTNREKGNEVLGQDDYGSVIKQGPFGNTSSSVKIAYIVGVHPLEHNSHQAAVEALMNNENQLKYCYYIYNVTVTKDAENYDRGRMNGQILAQNYAVPDIENENFDLVVDVHSNRGNYPVTVFVFSAVPNTTAEQYAYKIKENIKDMEYYSPPHQTCTPYIAVPLINAGVPTIVYETYIYEPYETSQKHLLALIKAVDNISFN